jgi:hypothetical protein
MTTIWFFGISDGAGQLAVNKRSIHLVSTQSVQRSQQPDARITLAEYFAEIVQGQGPDGAIFHWIVQRVGSADVLMWGQDSTHEEACASAKSYLQSLAKDNLQSA